MRLVEAVAPVLVLAAVAGCDVPPLAPPVPPQGDPALFQLDPALYACGRWSPAPPAPADDWGLFDVHFGRRGLEEPDDGPHPEHLERIRGAPGRVVHAFNVPRVRAILLTGAVEGLGVNFVQSVPDAESFPVRVVIRWTWTAPPEHFDYIRSLGGIIDNDYPAYLYGASRIRAVVPDSAIPLIRALPGIQYLEAVGFGCLD